MNPSACIESEAVRNAMGHMWHEPAELKWNESEQSEYPIAALPGGIQAAVEEVTEYVQCPAALAGVSALSALSVAAQHLADIRRGPNLVGPVSLFCLLIAESGERKSTCDGNLFKSVKDWERKALADAAVAAAECQAAIDAWDAKYEGIKKGIQEASKKGEPTEELSKALNEMGLKPRMAMQPTVLFAGDTRGTCFQSCSEMALRRNHHR